MLIFESVIWHTTSRRGKLSVSSGVDPQSINHSNVSARGSSAVELRGKIVHVTDGDTVGIVVGKETIRIRLEGIEIPAAKQSFGI
jgi:endonuclease YncB( thermonuclease family)